MDMLIDNINFLKTNYPAIYQKMQDIEKDTDQTFVQLEETKNGETTLKVQKEGKDMYLHSKYNPSREANTIVEQYENTENFDENIHVIFYGVGLGYHIDLFLQKHNNVSFSIYEPIQEILYHYLCNQDLKNLPLKHMNYIVTGNEKRDRIEFLKEIMKKKGKKIRVFSLPSYEKIFSKEYEEFLSDFKETVRNKRSSLHTNYAFQKRWIINSMMNFKEVLNTPNILLNKKGQFKGKPAILVAAGPSLDEEIENLRYIKENGLAYIFSVGSAISTLVHHDIYPDAACTYDPQGHNYRVFDKVVEKNITEIPMIFGSSVGYETLKKYPGYKLHMLTSQDTTATYYLKSKSEETIENVVDAPTIAIITLQLLYKLEFEKIILVGQNLAYREDKYYSSGIQYASLEENESKMKNLFKVKDVHGNDVLTKDSLNRMRQQMELYIKNFKEIDIINTTKGGAHIEGAEFIPLEQIIEKDILESVVDRNWMLIENKNYDVHYMKQQKEKMDKDYRNVNNLLKEVKETLHTIKRLCRNTNFNQAEKMYHKLDQVFKRTKTNDYFNTFILPMNRVFYEIFSNEIADVSSESNKMKKAETVINVFGKFIFICTKDMEQVENRFKEIVEGIEFYIKDDEQGETKVN